MSSASAEIRLHALLEMGSLDDPRIFDRAVELVGNGYPVVGQIGSVFGLWLDAQDDIAVQRVAQIKGNDSTKKISGMLEGRHFLSIVDAEVVAEELRWILESPEQYREVVGALFHVRAPIHPDYIYQVPEVMRSLQGDRYVIHNFEPWGHSPVSRFTRELVGRGITWVAATSLNPHDAREITTLEDAIAFCKERGGVELLFSDPQPARREVRGSYATVDLRGSAVRDGCVPLHFIERVLGKPLGETAKPKYEHAGFETVPPGLTGAELRRALLEYIYPNGNS